MNPTEAETRAALVAEASTWVGTPYVSNGAVKGKRGGTDCAMVLLAIYQNVGLIPREFDPRPYPAQWHVHQTAERYMATVLSFARPIPGPPLPGDVVLFKIGLVHAHGAIVTRWPHIIHALGGVKVCHEDCSKLTQGKRALWTVERRFFSYFPQSGEVA